MKKYDIIFESLQEKVNSGELTVEDASILNDVAFEKYGEDDTEYEEVTESADEEDEGVTYEQYLEAMEEELFSEAGARAKYINVLAEKQDKIKKEMDSIKGKMKVVTSEARYKELESQLLKLRSKYDELADEASGYSERIGSETRLIENKNVKYVRDHHDRNASDSEKFKKDNEIDERHHLKKILKDKQAMHGNYSADHGEYNRYNTGSYGHPVSSHDGNAKKAFNKKFVDTRETSMEKKMKRREIMQ